MSRMVSVDADEWAGVLKRLRALETVTNLFAASVTSGRVRIGGTATLLVDSSGGVIIHGRLTGEDDSEFTWSGTMTNNGPVNLNGDTAISGTLDVSGLVTLLNNLVLGAGGKITAGVLTIDPTAGTFGGALVSSNAIDVVAPSFNTTGNIFSQGTITSNALLRAEVNASVGSNLTVGGVLSNAGMPLKSGATPNVYVDGAGKMWRTS